MEENGKSAQTYSDRYLKSGSAITLAVLKGIEGIFAILLLIDAFQSINKGYTGILPIARMLSGLNVIDNIRSIIDYILTILSSVGFVMLVLTRKGAGMVHFSHKLKYIIDWILIILFGCAFFFSGAFKEGASWILLILAIAVAALFINYNRYVCIIMESISVEAKRDRQSPMPPTKINLCCYILMLVYASDVIYLLMSPANYANAAYNALFAAKYFFVTVFVRKMSAEHPLYREERSENLQE